MIKLLILNHVFDIILYQYRLYGLIIYAVLLPVLNITECLFPDNRGCVEIVSLD